MKTKFIEKAQFEQDALHLIRSFEKKHGTITVPFIPIEEIIENHLGLHLEILNLDNPDVLGFIDFSENLIVINDRLDPSSYPHMMGRFNYSLGHETGHHVYHRETVELDSCQEQLFEMPKPAQIMCRESESKNPIEWQADYFSSCLLMPEFKLHKALKAFQGNYAPLNIAQLTGQNEFSCEAARDFYIEQALRPIAEKMQVSMQALRIRMESKELITGSEQLVMV